MYTSQLGDNTVFSCGYFCLVTLIVYSEIFIHVGLPGE